MAVTIVARSAVGKILQDENQRTECCNSPAPPLKWHNIQKTIAARHFWIKSKKSRILLRSFQRRRG